MSKIIEKESSIMKFFRSIGQDPIAWSLRRLYCPVKKEDLVLEIGSGGNPYYRANVLCDAYLETEERFFEALITDRPIVLAKAERLPFKDGAFDFVIASHVLEHSRDPEKFISEIQRVGKAGYIEVPDAFMERLTNYGFHMTEITDQDGALLIRKKRGQIQDEELWELFKRKARGIFPHLISRYPFNFHVRYYWSHNSGGIKYKIVNPDYVFNWEPPYVSADSAETGRLSIKTRLHKIILFLFRQFFSQNIRNKNIDLSKYLICVQCGASLTKGNGAYVCGTGNHSYPLVRGFMPDFTNV